MKKTNSPYIILLYYKYVRIDDHESYARLHLKFCRSLGIKGRIIVAGEGINGTLSGTPDQTDAYIYGMRMDPRFNDMKFKTDQSNEHVFKKLYVRPKKEIVTMNLDENIDPNVTTGKRLGPKEFLNAMHEENIVVLDIRNDYEYDIGHFKNAVRPYVKNFKQFPEWIKKNAELIRDKKILTYCTGGVRCEKFSGLLVREGFTNVNQLKGGIIAYSKHPDTMGSMFEGKCYVFDERISVEVNYREAQIVVGKCYRCGESTDRYLNCSHLSCHTQFLCCEICEIKYRRCCSTECIEAAEKEHNESQALTTG